eukprot:TRINITY_DN88185_c0_g1_i1.p1 TRINITY_DN88185_c0_g1~~TRINITY_DN88185_c0_g1_i1.p1  ORF type:complete len:320 (-),score=76.64 TRINITY_DN88185_c0_g1_i1:221-1126(-)
MSTEPLSKQKAHDTGVCKPCAFFHRQGDGCHFGEACVFCHLCGKGAMKQRKQLKRQMMRDQQIKLKNRSRDKAAAAAKDPDAASLPKASITDAQKNSPLATSGGARTPLRAHAKPFVSMFDFMGGLSPAVKPPQNPSSSPSYQSPSFRAPPGLAEEETATQSPEATLTKQRAVSLQAELLCAFYAAPVQKQLMEILKTRSDAEASADFDIKLQKIVHEVLVHIIPKYGFEPSKEGVQQIQMCFQEFKEECAVHARGTRAWSTCSEAMTKALFDPEVEQAQFHKNIQDRGTRKNSGCSRCTR